MNLWEWFTTNTAPLDLFAAGGTVLIATLFATDRILTKGSHLRRVADITSAYEKRIEDLIAFHARELAEKDRSSEALKESRAEWKTAAQVERARADKVTDSYGAIADAISGVGHVLGSLDAAIDGKGQT